MNTPFQRDCLSCIVDCRIEPKDYEKINLILDRFLLLFPTNHPLACSISKGYQKSSKSYFYKRLSKKAYQTISKFDYTCFDLALLVNEIEEPLQDKAFLERFQNYFKDNILRLRKCNNDFNFNYFDNMTFNDLCQRMSIQDICFLFSNFSMTGFGFGNSGTSSKFYKIYKASTTEEFRVFLTSILNCQCESISEIIGCHARKTGSAVNTYFNPSLSDLQIGSINLSGSLMFQRRLLFVVDISDNAMPRFFINIHPQLLLSEAWSDHAVDQIKEFANYIVNLFPDASAYLERLNSPNLSGTAHERFVGASYPEGLSKDIIRGYSWGTWLNKRQLENIGGIEFLKNSLYDTSGVTESTNGCYIQLSPNIYDIDQKALLAFKNVVRPYLPRQTITLDGESLFSQPVYINTVFEPGEYDVFGKDTSGNKSIQRLFNG